MSSSKKEPKWENVKNVKNIVLGLFLSLFTYLVNRAKLNTSRCGPAIAETVNVSWKFVWG